jgi:hypothetical protein
LDYIKEFNILELEKDCVKDVVLSKIINSFFVKVFEVLKKKKYFRGNKKNITSVNDFYISNERTLNNNGVLEKSVIEILSKYFYEQVAKNITQEVFDRIILEERKDFIPLFNKYFNNIIDNNIRKWTFSSFNKFSSEKGRNPVLESFFINKFKKGVKVVKEYILIHKEVFKKNLNLSELEFNEKIVETLYFKKNKEDEDALVKNNNRKHVFTEEEKSYEFVRFFKKRIEENLFWGSTMLRKHRSSKNNGFIGHSIERELSKIKTEQGRKDFIKKMLISELGNKAGEELYLSGIDLFDAFGKKRLSIRNKERSLEGLLAKDQNLTLVLNNIRKKHKTRRAHIHLLYKQFQVLLELYEYTNNILGGQEELKRLLEKNMPTTILKQREKLF